MAFSKILQKAEQQYFLNLPIAHRRILGLDNKPSWTSLACFSTHFEIILALSNLKPSVLFWAETEGANASPVFNNYVETVVQPLFKSFGLEQYGYILQMIPNEVIVNGRENWGGAWVLADTRSAQWDVVRYVYFNANDTEHQIPITGEALGLPVLPGLSGYEMRFTITNTTATQELSEIVQEKVQPVVALDYRGSEDRMQTEWSKKHFVRCEAVAARHNMRLKFECHPWG
ncbi:hypothetical protein HBH52_001610 [Parastagonospora nodorum]|nr:hypothetical protein HBH52_001610 [Parastagonospora nodorum]